MSKLHIHAHDQPDLIVLETSDPSRIAAELKRAGVRFEQWDTTRELPPAAAQDQVIEAYGDSIQRLMATEGYRSVDVVSITPDHPQRDELRQKFLAEHTHAEDEVRFFVAGSGLFSLHIGEHVYNVLCTQGDLISVPAGTRHWFDMGPRPHFTAIRLFTNPDGWVARFTGDTIADRFPRMQAAT